jgi:hypothetical protein
MYCRGMMGTIGMAGFRVMHYFALSVTQACPILRGLQIAGPPGGQAYALAFLQSCDLVWCLASAYHLCCKALIGICET